MSALERRCSRYIHPLYHTHLHTNVSAFPVTVCYDKLHLMRKNLNLCYVWSIFVTVVVFCVHYNHCIAVFSNNRAASHPFRWNQHRSLKCSSSPNTTTSHNRTVLVRKKTLLHLMQLWYTSPISKDAAWSPWNNFSWPQCQMPSLYNIFFV